MKKSLDIEADGFAVVTTTAVPKENGRRDRAAT
jgi:hypothetical protein